MTDQPTDSAREDRVNEIIAGYLRAVQAGQAPDRQEILAQHPDLGTELTSFQGQARNSGIHPPIAGGLCRPVHGVFRAAVLGPAFDAGCERPPLPAGSAAPFTGFSAQRS
jgi:hypothetical protein